MYVAHIVHLTWGMYITHIMIVVRIVVRTVVRIVVRIVVWGMHITHIIMRVSHVIHYYCITCDTLLLYHM